MQLCFKVSGHKNYKWSLQAFNGSEMHTVSSTEYPILNRIKYLQSDQGLFIEENVTVDKEWIESLLVIDEQ